MSLVALIEELSLNAYPGVHQLHYDGWVLQVSPGRWRRANSVQALYASERALDEKIAYCEAFYKSQGKPAIFKLTRESPTGLDAALAERGYAKDAETSVQTVALEAVACDPVPESVAMAEPDDAYLEAFTRIHHFDADTLERWQVIQRAILPPMGYLGLRVNGRIEATAIGVVERGWLGVFGVGTDPALRQRGYARQIMQALFAWGVENGATHSYLQVMKDNAAALALYDRLGYHEAYTYWYRVK